MCIIVAKPMGVKMPSKKIISNCFDNNPDGAGIMFCARGKVYGYKGLMTFESVINKLEMIEKKFGSMNKMNVVMHFRIGTHGGNIAANTHPFPVTGSYKVMRSLQWVSDLGMAHNGIITDVSYHADIKRENVSDTMVFMKHVVHPIAKLTNIMKNDEILEALRLASGSKLCFIDGKGNMEVLGEFTFEDGVFYSNQTYKQKRIVYPIKSYDWRDWTSAAYKDWDDYEVKDDKIYLSKDDEDYLMKSLASEYGMELLNENDIIVFTKDYSEPVGKHKLAFSPADAGIYEWISGLNDFEIFAECDEYDHIIEAGDADA